MPKQKLKPRSDGRYQKSITDPRTGKRVYFYGASEREINKKILEYTHKLEMGKTFAEVADEWWSEACDGLASQSIKVYKPALHRAINKFGNQAIKDILPLHIAAFYKDLARQNFAQKTVANQRIVLNQIFTTAVINGDIIYNPCSSVPLPKGLKKSERSAASAEDEKRILNSSCEWLFPYFSLLSGMRKGEILALQWKDIDFINDKISVTKSVEHIGDRPYIKAPKTSAGVRELPLLTVLKDKIYPYRGDPDSFIISDTGDKPLTNRRFITLYNKYRKEVGIECTSHQLRHSYATIAVEEEVQPRDLQGILGHASAKITLEKYAHYREKSLKNVAKKLNSKYNDVKKMS